MQLCHCFWSRQLFLLVQLCISRVTHCPMRPQFALSENHLGNICFLWNIDRAKAVPVLLPAALAAEQTGSGCLFTRACQLLHTRSCVGNLLHRNPHCSHTGPASPLKHQHKHLKNHFPQLPRKKHSAAINLSSPGQMHLTNNCKQWIININKAFNWNSVEKHFPGHSWQEPLNKCCFFAKYNIGRVITSQQRLRTYVNIMAEAWAFQSMHFIGWSNLGILPKFCLYFPPLALSFLRRCLLFLSTHTTC